MDWKIKKTAACILAGAVLLGTVSAYPAFAEETETEEEKIPVKVLILPKFEVDEIDQGIPGEAQFYYEEYLTDSEAYDIPGGVEGEKLYVKDGIALYLTGMGKVNAALSTTAVLTDPRFDFSDAYVISTGCAGSAAERGVPGDVYIISSCIDYDLGHHVDSREVEAGADSTWFHDEIYDPTAFYVLDRDLTERVYELVKDVPLETTEKTRQLMAETFDNAEWAVRDPEVLKGTTVTGDNYWKGDYDHMNANMMAEVYGSPEPYAITEMEEVAVAGALERLDMLDRLIIIRDSVNMDVFMDGVTPEKLWGEPDPDKIHTDIQYFDIFPTAMKNNLEVGKVIIAAILDGTL